MRSFKLHGAIMIRFLSALFALFTLLTCFMHTALAQPAALVNYTDIWWNADGKESGWGMSISDQADQLFVAWYTYDANGEQIFITMPGCQLSNTRTFNRISCRGELFRTRGTPITSANYDLNANQFTIIGTALLEFSGPNAASFTYTINGRTIKKNLARTPFGTGVGSYPYDFSNLYWQENTSGWGLTLNQHSNSIFGVIYHYNESGNPLFLVLSGAEVVNGVVTGDLFQTRGSSTTNYLSDGWNSAEIKAERVGSVRFTPNRETFAMTYTYKSVTHTRQMSKLQFGNPSYVPPQPPAAGASPTGDCASWQPLVGTYDITYKIQVLRLGEAPAQGEANLRMVTKIVGGKYVVEAFNLATSRQVYKSTVAFNSNEYGQERIDFDDGSYELYSPITYLPRRPTIDQTTTATSRILGFSPAGAQIAKAYGSVSTTFKGRESITTDAGTFASSCRRESVSRTLDENTNGLIATLNEQLWSHSAYSHVLPPLRSIEAQFNASGTAIPGGAATTALTSITVNGRKLAE
jgi:hypothetical protein